MSFIAGVSFAKTPLAEISGKVAEIEACGWKEDSRGDPWAVSFRTYIPEGEGHAAEAELREIMGNYWLPADEVRSFASK